MRVRAAAFAGSWYPSSPDQCRRQIEGFFENVPEPPQEASEPLGGIVPHAGWTFSGHLAGKVLALLKGGQPPATVILMGGAFSSWYEKTLRPEAAEGAHTPVCGGALSEYEDVGGREHGQLVRQYVDCA